MWWLSPGSLLRHRAWHSGHHWIMPRLCFKPAVAAPTSLGRTPRVADSGALHCYPRLCISSDVILLAQDPAVRDPFHVLSALDCDLIVVTESHSSGWVLKGIVGSPCSLGTHILGGEVSPMA